MVYALITAILLCVQLVSHSAGLLLFVALIPLFVLASKDNSSRTIILKVWLAGFLYTAFSLSFLFWDHPQEAYGMHTWELYSFLGCAWVIFSIVNSLNFLIFGLVLSYFRGRLHTVSALLIIPGVYAAAEYLRAWFVSIFVWSSSGSLGPYWNYVSLGFDASSSPLIYAGRFVGLYGLALIVVVVNLALFQMFWQSKVSSVSWIIAAVLVAVAGATLYQPSTASGVEAAYISLPDSTNQYKSAFADVNMSNINTHPPLVLILPENHHLSDPENRSLYTTMSHLIASDGVVIASGDHNIDPMHNVITFDDQSGRTIFSQEKSFLIPLGEYIPLVYQPVLHLAGDNVYHRVVSALTKYPARHQEIPYIFRGISIGSLSCSGVFAPELFRSLANAGAQILTNSAHTSIFGRSGLFDLHNQAMARFNAVANARPFIQAARGGNSYIIDANGKIIRSNENKNASYAHATIHPSSKMTFYSRFGELFALVWGLIAVSYAVWKAASLKLAEKKV